MAIPLVPAVITAGSGLARFFATNAAKQWGTAITGRALATTANNSPRLLFNPSNYVEPAKRLSTPTIAASFGMEAIEDANDFNIPEVTPSGLIGSNAYYPVKNVMQSAKDAVNKKVISEVTDLLHQKAKNTYQQFTDLQERIRQAEVEK